MKTIITKDIHLIKEALLKGDVCAIPTETVYGLAGNALEENSILKIYEIKNRPSFDPLIVHVASKDQIHKYTKDIPKAWEKLIQDFMPGPLTLLLPKNEIIPDLVTSGLDKVAIRIPDHPLTLELLSILDIPLAAPSANPFGYISPTEAKHVLDQLGGKFNYILDGGSCHIGVESTIIGWEDGKTVVHRLGGLSIEVLENYLGPIKLSLNQNSNPSAPGKLDAHYAPKKPMVLKEDAWKKQVGAERIGAIVFKNKLEEISKENQIVLSEQGDLKEAARNLFKAMRLMDEMDVDIIIAEFVPDIGLGRAVNDRLKRAMA
jgi:L-threonylcarbamoyladenylate synthase